MTIMPAPKPDSGVPAHSLLPPRANAILHARAPGPPKDMPAGNIARADRRIAIVPPSADHAQMMERSLQDTYAPEGMCFGCGPANEHGLRIKSFPDGDQVIAEFTPQKYHEAFSGVLNGGIIGTLLDCHCNWTAAWHLMKHRGADSPPCTVTMEYAIKLRRPTPTDGPLRLVARVLESTEDVVTVAGELYAGDKVCDRCTGKFMAVKEGHPAYHRW